MSYKPGSSTPTILNWFSSDKKRCAIDRTDARQSKKPRIAATATKPGDIENLSDCSHPSTSEIVPSSSTINSTPQEDTSSTTTTEDIEEDVCSIPAAKEDTEEDFRLNYAPDENLVEQFIPPKNFKFPQEKDGYYSAGRSCQHGWFEKFTWLHYNTEKDALSCYTCISGKFKKLSISSNDEDKAFVDSGIRNWKRALEKLKKHEKSLHHRNIEAQLLSLEKGTPVSNLLNTKLKSDQIKARKTLRYIVTGIRYLARTGQPFRGRANNDGNL